MDRPLFALAGPLLDDAFPLPLDRPFTNRQAASAGVDRRMLWRLLRSGHVRRLLRGVYVAAQCPETLDLRVSAVALVAPGDAVVTDWTACWLWTGVLPPNADLDVPPVNIFRPAGGNRLRNGLCASGERTFAVGQVVRLGPLWVTTPLRTAWDLGRLSHRDIAIGGIDALARVPGFDLDLFVSGTEIFRGQRGVRQLRFLAPLADPRSESPGESTLRLRWLDLTTLPRPESQVPILDPSGREVARIDLGLPGLCYGCEYDGEMFHSSDGDRDHDDQRREWLLREYGWVVESVRKEDVYGHQRDVERILLEGVREARRTLAERLAELERRKRRFGTS